MKDNRKTLGEISDGQKLVLAKVICKTHLFYQNARYPLLVLGLEPNTRIINSVL